MVDDAGHYTSRPRINGFLQASTLESLLEEEEAQFGASGGLLNEQRELRDQSGTILGKRMRPERSKRWE
jgi:hypothetical protein